MRDKRKNNTGVRFLDETQQAALAAALSAPPGDGGLWTSSRKWLRGYPRRSSVVSVTCQVGNISNVSVILYKHLVRIHQAAATPVGAANI